MLVIPQYDTTTSWYHLRYVITIFSINRGLFWNYQINMIKKFCSSESTSTLLPLMLWAYEINPLSWPPFHHQGNKRKSDWPTLMLWLWRNLETSSDVSFTVSGKIVKAGEPFVFGHWRYIMLFDVTCSHHQFFDTSFWQWYAEVFFDNSMLQHPKYTTAMKYGWKHLEQ